LQCIIQNIREHPLNWAISLLLYIKNHSESSHIGHCVATNVAYINWRKGAENVLPELEGGGSREASP
jgi:hypothetical protein